MWACASHTPGGRGRCGLRGCGTGPAMRGGSLTLFIDATSTEPDVGVLHHFAPKRHLILHKTAEFLRSCMAYVDIELLHDRRGSTVRHKHPVPFIRFKARQSVGNRRNIRKTLESAFARMRDRFHFATLNEADHRGPVRKEKFYLTCHHVIERKTTTTIGHVA